MTKNDDKVFNLDEDSFDDFINENSRVVVDFWATWCSPCMAMEPVIKGLAEEYDSKISFAKVNVEKNRGIASRYGIQAIPAFIFFKDGGVQHQVKGMLKTKNFEDEIKNAFEL